MPHNGQMSYFSNAATATATAIKAADGWLYILEVSNPNTSDAFVQLFDALAANVTLGTTVPRISFLVPAGVSSTVRGAMDKKFENGLGFNTAITYAVTTTPTGNTAPGSNLTLNATYV